MPKSKDVLLQATQLTASFVLETLIHSKEKVSYTMPSCHLELLQGFQMFCLLGGSLIVGNAIVIAMKERLNLFSVSDGEDLFDKGVSQQLFYCKSLI